VVGGGIAGCATAYYLARRGVGVTLAELVPDGRPSLDLRPFRLSRFAEGATGKPRSVL
jgi:2-polyprenyl-6-methoxyphenol hydroxylase-like FAD-dependent oxidoreductase